mgnify:CR=1 FL=1
MLGFHNTANVFDVYITKKRMRRLNGTLLDSYNLIYLINDNTEKLLTNLNDKHIFQHLRITFRNINVKEKTQIYNRYYLTTKVIYPQNERQSIGHVSKITGLCDFLYLHTYRRLGKNKAPRFVTWSSENRSQLIRVPAASAEFRRAELRSPDPAANPYIAFALLIWAGLEGIQKQAELPEPVDVNLFKADANTVAALEKLPESIDAAKLCAKKDSFIKARVPEKILEIYCAN